MKWLSDLAIERPVTTIILIVTMIGLGLISLLGIPMQLMPELNFPVVTIQVVYKGVAPEDMEELVSKPIEDAISGVQGIEKVSSYSNEGSSYVVIQFKWGSDLDKKATDIREKMSKIRGKLPDGIDEPVITKLDIMGKETVMNLNLAGDNLQEVRQVAEDILKPKLERINGVGNIEVLGGLKTQILVKVNPSRLEAYGQTVSGIVDLLKNSSVNMPAGKLKQGDKEFLVRAMGKIEDVQSIKNLVLVNKNGKQLYLKDVVDIYISTEDRESITRMNSKESVSIEIQKESGGNAVQISDVVRHNMKSFKDTLPKGMELSIGRDTAIYIKDSMEFVRDSALIGFLLSAIIIFLFLKNVRATIIICLAIPTSVIFTFVLIKGMGLTLNLLSLGGLALGIGRLVDDSIIVLENIYRHMAEYKKPPMEAARDGASEMGLPILASALTTIAVFLPVIFTEGMAGEIFRDFSYTVTFSLCASMIVALTFVPMISSKTLKTEKNVDHEGKLFKKVKDIYKKILNSALKRRITTISIALVLFVGSIFVFGMVGMEFFTKTDRGEFNVVATIPNGLELTKVDRISKEMENVIINKKKQYNFIDKYITTVTKNQVSIYVSVGSKDKRKIGVEDIMAEFRKDFEKIADANIRIIAASMGPSGGGGAVQVNIYGDDYKKLAEIADKVKEKMKGVKGVVDLKSSFEGGNPELRIKVDRRKAEYFGVSIGYVSGVVASKVSGTTAFNIQSVGEEVGVKVQLDEDYRNSVEKLYDIDIPFTGKEGGSVKLRELATITLGEGPTQIIRQDKSKVVNISANNYGRDLKAIGDDINLFMKGMDLPQGYSYKFGGEQKDMMETMIKLAIAFAVSIFLMYAVMAAQFESFVLPGIVMVTVPLGIIGVALGLLVTGFTVSVTVLIGIIMLGGIVVNNAIVLIDYTNILRAREIPRDEAIKRSGANRLRPIFMTVATAVIGMVPMAFGIGAGSDFYQPLAITVIFGLSMSTLLTLVVIPVLYSLLDDIMEWLKKKFFGKDDAKVSVVLEK